MVRLHRQKASSMTTRNCLAGHGYVTLPSRQDRSVCSLGSFAVSSTKSRFMSVKGVLALHAAMYLPSFGLSVVFADLSVRLVLLSVLLFVSLVFVALLFVCG